MFLQLILILVVLIPLMAIVLDSQVGRALASRLERRGLGEPQDLMAERMAYLEGEVERLTGEIGRIGEESQFLHQLLAERDPEAKRLPEEGSVPPPGDHPD